MRHGRRVLVAGLFAATLLVIASCGGASDEASTPALGSATSAPGAGGAPTTRSSAPVTTVGDEVPPNAFYRPPEPMPPGRPGDIIRSEPLEGAPAGVQAWRVLYHSTDPDGKDIAVGGAVIAPAGQSPTPRPVVSWAHPTTGVADGCAPSYSSGVFALVAGLQAFLDAGWVVAATDYAGLGTPGSHPFLVGESEGRSQLDAARAAHALADANADTQVLLWGHSQGGQSSLFAAQIAPTYAPDLRIAAVAAAAPAGKLSTLLGLIERSEAGVTLGSFTLSAYLATYGPSHPTMSISQVITPAGQAALPEILSLCNLQQSKRLNEIADPLLDNFFEADPASTPPWSDLLKQNEPGQVKIAVPVYIAQGSEDKVVVPSTTDHLVKDMCAKGTGVAFHVYQGTDHNLIGYTAAPDVVVWMKGALQGPVPAAPC